MEDAKKLFYAPSNNYVEWKEDVMLYLKKEFGNYASVIFSHIIPKEYIMEFTVTSSALTPPVTTAPGSAVRTPGNAPGVTSPDNNLDDDETSEDERSRRALNATVEAEEERYQRYENIKAARRKYNSIKDGWETSLPKLLSTIWQSCLKTSSQDRVMAYNRERYSTAMANNDILDIMTMIKESHTYRGSTLQQGDRDDALILWIDWGRSKIPPPYLRHKRKPLSGHKGQPSQQQSPTQWPPPSQWLSPSQRLSPPLHLHNLNT